MKRTLFIAIALAACGGAEAGPGLDAPVRVQDGQYFPTPLPGDPPDPMGAPEHPAVTSVELDTPLIYSGANLVRVAGRVEDAAVALAVGLPDVSNAHWVFPADGSTPEFPGELTWTTRMSFSRDIAPGLHPMRVVGIDANGNAGRQYEQTLCFLPTYPDNLHACDPTAAPPEVVITLDWDRDADVDLELVTPVGRRIDPKHPLVNPPVMGMTDPASAHLDRDSLRDCVPDGWRQESIAFDARPGGDWQVFVRLFAGCGETSVRWRLRVLEAQGEMPDRNLVVTFEEGGELVTAYDEDQGVGPGLLAAQLAL